LKNGYRARPPAGDTSRQITVIISLATVASLMTLLTLDLFGRLCIDIILSVLFGRSLRMSIGTRRDRLLPRIGNEQSLHVCPFKPVTFEPAADASRNDPKSHVRIGQAARRAPHSLLGPQPTATVASACAADGINHRSPERVHDGVSTARTLTAMRAHAREPEDRLPAARVRHD
jgi:hypothetical protein